MSDPEIVESFLANQRMGEHKDDDLEKENMILKQIYSSQDCLF